MMAKAVFLDRDGTVIREKNYLGDPADVELLPGAADGIQRLRAAGFLAVLTTNQSGVARGFFTEDAVRKVHERLELLLAQAGTRLDAAYYCPHLPEGGVGAYAKICDCRKPAPGMIRAAVRDWGIDLAQSWVVGDKADDLRFGRGLGLPAVLVLTGYGKKTLDRIGNGPERPAFIARDLAEAAQIILHPGRP